MNGGPRTGESCFEGQGTYNWLLGRGVILRAASGGTLRRGESIEGLCKANKGMAPGI